MRTVTSLFFIDFTVPSKGRTPGVVLGSDTAAAVGATIAVAFVFIISGVVVAIVVIRKKRVVERTAIVEMEVVPSSTE
jgi:hypothetical protein